MPAAPSHFRSRGFTLVEAIATIVVLSIIGLVGARITAEASARYTNAVVRARLHNAASAAMDRITSELRDIQPTSATGAVGPDINSAFSATAITFNSTAGGSRTITFNSGAGTITLSGSAASSQILAQDCSAFTLTYSGSTDSAIAPGGNQALIRRIAVSLTLSSGGITETLRSKVFIRSMMSGSGAP